MLKVFWGRTVTNAIYRMVMRRAIGFTAEEVEEVVAKPDQSSRPDPEPFAKEVALMVFWTVALAAVTTLTVPVALLEVGSSPHVALLWVSGLIATWCGVGMVLHLVRLFWARHVFNREMRQYRKGNADCSNSKGLREYSSDMDLIHQAAVTAVLWILL